MKHLPLLFVTLGLLACKDKEADKPAKPTGQGTGAGSGTAVAAARSYSALARAELNRWAVRENLALYWIADRDADQTIDPDEVTALLFYPDAPVWVQDGKFTPAFDAAFDQLVAASKATPTGLSPDELQRRAGVGKDLDQGRATLVHSDLTKLTPGEQAFVGSMLEVARLIDVLYDRQSGAGALAAQLPKGDRASASLFRRNRGAACVGASTENDPTCTAIPGQRTAVVDVYPPAPQASADFCQKLEKLPDAEALLAPFVVVRGDGDVLAPVPYSVAYAEQMGPIADELERAAGSLDSAKEAPLQAYLRAAAASFRSNDWQPADEAWSKMNAENSKWYVRVAPDETYWEPCAHKAAFHLTFALINQDSLAWQKKLVPVQQDMEAAIAKAAGAPYKARTVTFHLPDFIDIIVNAGDDRDALGATIGQSLPNWGPVSAEGRGRTVAMSNLYTDADSLAARRAQAESLLDATSAKAYADDPAPGLLATILHEATHNLGPAHEYKVDGKTDDQALGGPIASVFEELKAQTGGLFLIELLRSKGLITDELAAQTYVDSIVWAFGHISQGMYTGSGSRKAYSNLAAIQIGFLLGSGALRWDDAIQAANGKDTGAFVIDTAKLVPSVEVMMTLVGGIKARGDRAAAEELIATYVDGKAVPQAVIAERTLRFPKASFVYAVSR